MLEPILSICINTRNRAAYLSETLDSILSQTREGVEVVVVDGASDDDTPTRMRAYASAWPAVQYIRSDIPVGIDEGYDLTVQHARGGYCWMMTDDDLIAEGAIDRLMAEIAAGYDLILVDLDCYTKDMALSLHQPLYGTMQDRVFSSTQAPDFWAVCGKGLSYIGSVVLRRSIWFEHERTDYYGSYFVHVGVILESTAIHRVMLMSKPYIKYRSGNSRWTPRSFEIWNFKWPRLIWASARLPEAAKQEAVEAEPWRRKMSALKSRAMGEYDVNVFRTWLADRLSRNQRLPFLLMALLPRGVLNSALLLFCLMFRRSNHYTIYNFILSSPWPCFARQMSAAMGVKFG
jgi:glycosyltransferase involved in cell wall biosynthesis